MKIIIRYFFLLIVVSIQAQEFKPYKIKSGKITYDKLKYSTVSGFSIKNGVETSYSKQVPYVTEQVNYYWDEFGDVAFQETYQVSTFGGKLLPEKVKISEILYVDEYQYYFSTEENKVNKASYRLRKKCKEQFQYYQIKDSWIETLYMGTEKSGTKEILKREADLYKISNSHDIHIWKGLELKNENFATKRSGERLYPHRTKIATEIDTLSVINKELFNPIWLKREKLYSALDENKIVELIDARPDVTEQADNIEGIELQKNDILLFVTTKLTVGKMQIIAIDKNNQLVVKYCLYSSNKALDWRDLFKIENNNIVNIDSPDLEDVAPTDQDFKWYVSDNKMLIPQNNISVLLLKPSRTKELKIK